MQYKPNLPENQVNATSVLVKGYEADIVFWPKNPKANFLNGKMNISYAITKDYENVRLHRREKTKPNSKPIFFKDKLMQPSLPQRFTSKNHPWAIRKTKPNSKPISLSLSCLLFLFYQPQRASKQSETCPARIRRELIFNRCVILNRKPVPAQAGIHSHPAGNKLHTPRRQSWGCFDLSGRATPKTAGLGFSLVALRYYSQTTDKIQVPQCK